MKWHNCKTDPPKVDGHYILQINMKYETGWIGTSFYSNGKKIDPYVNKNGNIGHWFDDYEEYICYDDCAYKWAEVELDKED